MILPANIFFIIYIHKKMKFVCNIAFNCLQSIVLLKLLLILSLKPFRYFRSIWICFLFYKIIDQTSFAFFFFEHSILFRIIWLFFPVAVSCSIFFSKQKVLFPSVWLNFFEEIRRNEKDQQRGQLYFFIFPFSHTPVF